MSLQVAGRQAEGYTISTEVYAGPLDLLLDLIEHSELDITRLALAQVTDQYLAYLHNLENNNAAEVSAFLVIAARLVQIKSAALLPRPSLDFTGPTPEDDAEALARQLILYKRFKEIAQFLDRQDLAGLHSYLRIAPPPKSDVPVHLDLSGVSVQDLIQAARDVFHSQRQLAPLSQVVSMPRVTIREKISNLIETLRQFGKATFRSILTPGSTRVDVVVTFLAMLELIKRHLVEAQQDTLFGDISIQSQGDMQEELDSELEFTE
ncbi:MAG TPA: segregation/condensation protein A [Longilinea sp.]|nr:segregation/condensation protein A [Longilinea sp.]